MEVANQTQEGEAFARQIALGYVSMGCEKLFELRLLHLVGQVADEQSAPASELLLGDVGHQLGLGEGGA